MKENWKPVRGNPNYMVSNLGRVQGPKKILKPHRASSGYMLVCLSLYQKPGNETRYIHRLVAEAFVPNSDPDRYIVNHKDRNILNNSVENLEWASHMENVAHWSIDSDSYTALRIENDLRSCFERMTKLEEKDRQRMINLIRGLLEVRD